MSLYFRKVSLRRSLSTILSRRSLLRIRGNKLKGRYLFRAIVRFVLEFMEWWTQEPAVEEVTDVVTTSLRISQSKKVEKKLLNLEDRAILLINPPERSSSDKKYIFELFKKLRAFRKYPEEHRKSLAGLCFYQYLQPGRVIVRQGHPAENLYFIISGEVNLTRVVTDSLTGDTKEVDMGSLYPGDMFGEIALLHNVPRTATIVTKTSVDLLLVNIEDFNEVLREKLTNEWNVLQDALVHFNYFETWDDERIRECCILSRLKDFEPNEVLLGDGRGLVNYVHFLLEGECRLIEHILVTEETTRHGTRYKLFDPENVSSRTTSQLKKKENDVKNSKTKRTRSKKDGKETVELTEMDTDLNDPVEDYTQITLPKRPTTQNFDVGRMSIVTATLVDVVNEWHEITDVAEKLMREPSVMKQRYPQNVKTIFMQVCIFYRGACFGLGEKMLNRRIVCVTPVRCFLIPRYWLMEHNRANIWQRVKLFMDSKFPSKDELFKEFMRSRKWVQYKRKLVNDIISRGRHYRNCATVHDVPYSIRITEEIDAKL